MAREKVKRYAGEEYWGRPVPGFGDRHARLLLVGLAPGAHGANRTGRMFTGDRSGDWLFRSLHKVGFASQAESARRSDGLRLNDCFITATLRCAPPMNKPLAAEIARCRHFLLEEAELLVRIRVIVGLGRIGFDAALAAYRQLGVIDFGPRPRFAHGSAYRFGSRTFIASFHPSQQNTFTGRLTEAMLDEIFLLAKRTLDGKTGER